MIGRNGEDASAIKQQMQEVASRRSASSEPGPSWTRQDALQKLLARSCNIGLRAHSPSEPGTRDSLPQKMLKLAITVAHGAQVRRKPRRTSAKISRAATTRNG